MNEPDAIFEAAIVGAIESIKRQEWNSLLSQDDSPFVEWDWLQALEASGSAAPRTGWTPYHIVVRASPRKKIIAACPLYLKIHSMGEFVFDHAWAEAAGGAGIRYYPKLLVGIPFTPHTGRRILTAPCSDRPRLIRLIGRALAAFCAENRLSSVHVNFCTAEESSELSHEGFVERVGYQYHWSNLGFASFDDYLARLRHKRRSAVRRERSALAAQRVTIRVMVGEQVPDRMFAAMFRIYLSTVEKLYWGRQYLTPEFFDLLRRNFKRYICFVAAFSGRRLIAGAVNLEKSGALYGRYWGCFRELPYLHFNVCYYAGIEHCIERGLERFEPGAGGEYKWLRGFDPVITRSAHFIADPRLRRAIAGFLTRERREVESWVAAGNLRSQLKAPPPADLEQR